MRFFNELNTFPSLCCSSLFHYLHTAGNVSQSHTWDIVSLASIVPRRTRKREPRAGSWTHPNPTGILLGMGACRGGGSTVWKMQFQWVCIIESSKWGQNERHGSLIVNMITVSGNTAVWTTREIIEMVKSEGKICLFTHHQLSRQPHD